MRERLREENDALKRAASLDRTGTTLLGSSHALRSALEHLPEVVASDGAEIGKCES